MNKSFWRDRRRFLPAGLMVLLALMVAPVSKAASWSGIEPYKSTRADVEKVLGPAQRDQMSVDGSLHFHVVGGTAIVSFVDAKFATAKKLSPKKIGTVKGIILQHDAASDSPESLKLIGNSSFLREQNSNVVVFRNLKDGLAYTFVDGKLKTSYFFPSGGQLPKTQGE
jgi:hypothetical protein